MSEPTKSYRSQLTDLVDAFIAVHGTRQKRINGEMSGQEARAIHEQLCRQRGLTTDELVAEWNRLSPDDLWVKA